MGRRNRNRNKSKNKNLKSGGALVALAGKQEEVIELDEEREAGDFKLMIPLKVYEKIMYWINKASPKEVSGFGHLDFDEDTREFTVRDAILLDQVVSSGSAEISAQALGKALYEHRDDPGALKWHWHSHPTFGVFWSPTDMNLIKELGEQGWIVATVLNCKRESRTAFYTTADLFGKPHPIFIDDFPLEIQPALSARELREYDRQFDEKVTEYKHVHPVHQSNSIPSGRILRERRTGASEYDVHEGFHARVPPTGRLFGADYDESGFASWKGDYVYNPFRDTTLPTVEEKYSVLDTMSDADIKELEEADYSFPGMYKDYIQARAADQKFNSHLN